MKIKEILTTLFSKSDKELVEEKINIDYHLERDGEVLDFERPFVYPSKNVCNFDKRVLLGLNNEEKVLAVNWIQASNRFPKKLKRDKKMLPEFLIMIILSIIISLPYSICAGFLYILRRGHAYITRNIRDEKDRYQHYKIKSFLRNTIKMLSYGLIVTAIFIFSLNNILNIDNGWTEFCVAAKELDESATNITVFLMFVFITGIIVSYFINKIIIPVFFIRYKKTLISSAVDFIINLPMKINLTSDIPTDARREKLELYETINCPAFTSLYIPFNESPDSNELYYYRKHAYVGELTWRFISPFAYRYYCMAYGYYIPISIITKRSPIPYNIFYRANPYARNSKTANFFTNEL